MTMVDRHQYFMIIGRPKCGTTTLAEWLSGQEEIAFSKRKEPRFFSKDRNWQLGMEWYSAQFHQTKNAVLRGEATQQYTHPKFGQTTASRIAQAIPDAKLIYLLRHPEDRIRSQFRARDYWRSDNSSFPECLETPDNDYLTWSMYYTCLAPFIERFDRSQILVVRTEDLDSGESWRAVLDFLGLSWRPTPQVKRNVSRDKRRNVLSIHKLSRQTRRRIRQRLRIAPEPLRRAGKTLLEARARGDDRLVAESLKPIPGRLMQPVWDDIAQLETWLGLDRPLWPRESGLSPQSRSEGRLG